MQVSRQRSKVSVFPAHISYRDLFPITVALVVMKMLIQWLLKHHEWAIENMFHSGKWGCVDASKNGLDISRSSVL